MKTEQIIKKGFAQALYDSPRADVIGIAVQGVLCQSGDTNPFGMGNNYDDGVWD